MKVYRKVGWLDHVQDIETGEVIQEGTPLSQTNLGHMDDGILLVTQTTIAQEGQISDIHKEITILKNATLNNMVNNVFLKNFETLESVEITSGIYDPASRKIYV